MVTDRYITRNRVADLVDEVAVLLLNKLELLIVHAPIIAQDPALVKLDLEFSAHLGPDRFRCL